MVTPTTDRTTPPPPPLQALHRSPSDRPHPSAAHTGWCLTLADSNAAPRHLVNSRREPPRQQVAAAATPRRAARAHLVVLTQQPIPLRLRQGQCAAGGHQLVSQGGDFAASLPVPLHQGVQPAGEGEVGVGGETCPDRSQECKASKLYEASELCSAGHTT